MTSPGWEVTRAVRLSYPGGSTPGERFTASGIHLGGGWILTANHCAAEGPDAYQIHVPVSGQPEDGHPGTLRWRSGNDEVDLALVHAPRLADIEKSRLRLARIERSQLTRLPVTGGSYPRYGKSTPNLKKSEFGVVQMDGEIPLGDSSNTPYAVLQLSGGGPSIAAELPSFKTEDVDDDPWWGGASGAGLITTAQEPFCVGVIANRRSKETSKDLRIATLNGLWDLPANKRSEFWGLLSVAEREVPMVSAPPTPLSLRLFMILGFLVLVVVVAASFMFPRPSPPAVDKVAAWKESTSHLRGWIQKPQRNGYTPSPLTVSGRISHSLPSGTELWLLVRPKADPKAIYNYPTRHGIYVTATDRPLLVLEKTWAWSTGSITLGVGKCDENREYDLVLVITPIGGSISESIRVRNPGEYSGRLSKNLPIDVEELDRRTMRISLYQGGRDLCPQSESNSS